MKEYMKRYNKLEQAKDKRHRDLYLSWLTNKHKHITSNDAAMTYYEETYLERDLKVIHFPKNEKKPFEFVKKQVGFLTEADFDDDGELLIRLPNTQSSDASNPNSSDEEN